MRCRQCDEDHGTVERTALGGEDAADAERSRSEFTSQPRCHDDDLLAEPCADLLGQPPADDDVALGTAHERRALDECAVQDGDARLEIGVDAVEHHPHRLRRAAGQRLRLHAWRCRSDARQGLRRLQDAAGVLEGQFGRQVPTQALALDLQVAGEVAGRVADDLLGEAVEEPVQEDVGHDREGSGECSDGAALAIAQQVARGDQHEDGPAAAPDRCWFAPSPNACLAAFADAADRGDRLQRRGAERRVERHQERDHEHHRRDEQAAFGAHRRIDHVLQPGHGSKAGRERPEIDADPPERRRGAQPDRVAEQQPCPAKQRRLREHKSEQE